MATLRVLRTSPEAAQVYGLTAGLLLPVLRESPKFWWVVNVGGDPSLKWIHGDLKISKNTRRCCSWARSSTNPLFGLLPE